MKYWVIPEIGSVKSAEDWFFFFFVIIASDMLSTDINKPPSSHTALSPYFLIGNGNYITSHDDSNNKPYEYVIRNCSDHLIPRVDGCLLCRISDDNHNSHGIRTRAFPFPTRTDRSDNCQCITPTPTALSSFPSIRSLDLIRKHEIHTPFISSLHNSIRNWRAYFLRSQLYMPSYKNGFRTNNHQQFI
ncbi:hypothetical protein BDB01DRAFT_788782 [Pilobolus umbonatus]|nr:hypothetical protein BDB01DRAFT_788782 [Pilobolus umbonatus]